jgi:hypothetical protein
MEQKERNQIKALLKQSFDKYIKFDEFTVEFPENNPDIIVAKYSGLYNFHLIGSTPSECLIALGGTVGELFNIEDIENTINALIKNEDDTFISFEGSNTLYTKETDEDEAEEVGKSMAKSLNAAIQSIIDESKKKMSNDNLPFGSRITNQLKPNK